MAEEEFPVISVIIPNRNRTSVLCRAVESVINQTYKNWEIIIVDDSDEEIFREIEGLYGGSQNIHVYRGDRTGDYGARCKGFTISEGKYVAFLDSDDYWEPKKLERHTAFFVNGGKISVSWDNLFVEKLNGEKVKVAPFSWHGGNNIVPQSIILKALMKENFIHMSCGVVKKNSITAIGGPFMVSPFDYVLWINLATRYSFVHVDEYLTTKTESLDWIGSNKKILFRENWNVTKLKLRVWLKNNNQFSVNERVLSFIKILLMSVGIQILLSPSIRKFFRPVLFFRD